MKTIRILILILISYLQLNAQDFQFAWLTDLHIGFTNADVDLENCINKINNNQNIKFVIASGDITEKGRNSELEKVKSILEKLNKPYYIIPGNHDTKWSESGLTKFTELFGDNKFSFKQGNSLFIGLNSGIPWRGGGGHISPEDLNWLTEELESNSFKELFFVVHHPLNDGIDNWYKAVNILNDYPTKLVMVGHGHNNELLNFSGLPGAMSRAAISKNRDSYGFTLVSNETDSIKFYEVDSSSIAKYWGGIDKNLPLQSNDIDSAETIIYDAEIVADFSINETMVAPVEYWNGNLITASNSGLVSCYDTLGNEKWSFDVFGNVYSKPVVTDNGIVLVGTLQGDLYSINIKTGEQIQSIGFGNAITSKLIVIDYKGEKNLMIPKNSSDDDAVVVGLSNGEVYCYDVETLQEFWKNNSAKGMIETEPLYYNDRIYYGSWDGNFYCIDAKKGWLIWKWNETKNFYFSPAAVKPITDGKHIYLTTPDKIVYKLEMNLGKTVWKNDDYDVWESIGITNDNNTLLLKGIYGSFHTLSASNGRTHIEYKIGYDLDTNPIEIASVNNLALFGTKQGDVYRIDLNQKKYKKLLFLGNARPHSIKVLDSDKFLFSNMDGRVVIFKYSEKENKIAE